MSNSLDVIVTIAVKRIRTREHEGWVAVATDLQGQEVERHITKDPYRAAGVLIELLMENYPMVTIAVFGIEKGPPESL